MTENLLSRGLGRVATPLMLVAALGLAGMSSAVAAPDVQRSAKVGEHIYEVVYNPKDKLVYVAVAGPFVQQGEAMTHPEPQLVGFDAESLEVKRTINTGKTVPFGLALNSKTQKFYSTDPMTGGVAVIDVTSGKELAVIKAAQGGSTAVRQVLVDETTNKIYVTAIGGFERDGKPGPDSAVWVIDGKTDKLEATIAAPVKSATGLALDAKAQRLYVSDMALNEVAEIDLKTREVLRRFPTGAGIVPRFGVPKEELKPQSDTINIEVDPVGRRLFAMNQASGTVTVIGLDDGKLLQTIKTGEATLSARLHPKTGELYVANRGDGTVSVIDGSNYFVTAHLQTGIHPQTIAIDPESGRVYVTNKTKGKGRGAAKEAPEPYEPSGNTITLITP